MRDYQLVITMISLAFAGAGLGFALALLVLRRYRFPKRRDTPGKSAIDKMAKQVNFRNAGEPRPGLDEQSSSDGSVQVRVVRSVEELKTAVAQMLSGTSSIFNLPKLKQAYEDAVLNHEQEPYLSTLDNGIIALGELVQQDKVSNVDECMCFVQRILERKDAERILAKAPGVFDFFFDGDKIRAIAVLDPDA